MQLVAYGAQDIYLTGNPQITFFKVVYRRHTNFSIESIKQTFSGNADYNSEATVTISRNGDLIHRLWLEHVPSITPPVVTKFVDGSSGNVYQFVPNYGHALIKEVELEIGGQTIDSQTGQWMQAWSDLSEFNPTSYGFAERLNLKENTHRITSGTSLSGMNTEAEADDKYERDDFGKTLFQKMSGNGNTSGVRNSDNGTLTAAATHSGDHAYGVNAGAKVITDAGSTAGTALSERIFIPLQFWFCKNIGLALPLIALQYHEVKVKFSFEDAANLYGFIGCSTTADDDGTGGAVESAQTSEKVELTAKAAAGSGKSFDLWVDYIYLDTDERRRFAQVSHEYLIEQVQYQEESLNDTVSTHSPDINLSFNHPVKELIWFARNTSKKPFNTADTYIAAEAGVTEIEAEVLYPVVYNVQGGSLVLEGGGELGSTFSEKLPDGSMPHELIIRDLNAVGRQHGTATFLSDISERKLSGTDGGSWQLSLNGHDRFAERDTQYFTRTQVNDYHTGCGGVFNRDSVSVYSFSLKPEEHQPSGTCNFSRIDTATLKGRNIKFPTGANEISVYAVNYNVLRIMSGMGGLAYSN